MSAAAHGSNASRQPRHGLRIAVIWIVLSAIACVLVGVVWGPHLPPGGMTDEAASQRFDNLVLGLLATPVVVGVLVYFGYALVVWRASDDDTEDGPPIRGNLRVQTSWIAITSAVVIGVFGFGTYELVAPAGAGAGQGPSPLWKPGGAAPLQVQVIAQQWRFTYRFPQFGGVETPEIELPAGTQVQFNVTSLDVIHSFWAYELGVKADANPGVNNVVYVKTDKLGTFNVRCSELCGIWHGAMTNLGQVVSSAEFQSWIGSTVTQYAAITKTLPAYATTYDPNAIARLSKLFTDAGMTGAGGGYYGGQYSVSP